MSRESAEFLEEIIKALDRISQEELRRWHWDGESIPIGLGVTITCEINGILQYRKKLNGEEVEVKNGNSKPL